VPYAIIMVFIPIFSLLDEFHVLPLPMDFGATSTPEQGESSPTIVIPPPDVKMMDSTVKILYLSSSLSSSQGNLSEVSAHASIERPSSETQVLTSVDLLSTS